MSNKLCYLVLTGKEKKGGSYEKPLTPAQKLKKKIPVLFKPPMKQEQTEVQQPPEA